LEPIQAIWVIGAQGKVLFSDEFYSHALLDINSALFGSMIMGIHILASEFGEEDVQKITLGDMIIYLSRDDDSNIVFALKCDKKANKLTINKVLYEVERLFSEIFEGTIESEEMDIGLFYNFKKELDKLIGLDERTRVESLLESL